jgi:hypothetical protein
MNATELGQTGLAGWREKVAARVAGPASDFGCKRIGGQDDDDAERQPDHRTDHDCGSDRHAAQMIHRLLPQPGGFEGFVATEKRLEPDDLSVANCPNVGHESVGCRAAAHSFGARPSEYHHVVLVLDELLGVAAERIPQTFRRFLV